MSELALRIEGLHVEVDGAEILRGVDLEIPRGELHALMGPNGSGKSTLANTLLGNPAYTVTSGRIFLGDTDVTELETDARAALGLFLAFQHPEEIPGVSVLNFLRQALAKRKGIADLSILEVRLSLMEWTKRLGMDARFTDRYLNEGFSGGERKRNEVLQLAMMEPDVAILDEIDSGLDIDALQAVATGIGHVRTARPHLGLLLVTHYRRILDYLPPERIHILIDGRIVVSGGPELAQQVEANGFDMFRTVPA
ncbi:MAG: Fe-S cluster assembly ATPase SufC [Acidimicrobiia bacterium]